MYETYSAFKCYGDFHGFATSLHIQVVLARFGVLDAEKKYQDYCAKLAPEDYNSSLASFYFDEIIKEKTTLTFLEEVERNFFNALSDDAKKEMTRLCKEYDGYIQSTKKAG